MEVAVVVEADLLVFHAAPRTLDEDGVETAAAAVHADADFGLVEPAGEAMAREYSWGDTILKYGSVALRGPSSEGVGFCPTAFQGAR